MPRKRLESLNRLMDYGFDPPFVDSDINLGTALQMLSAQEELAIRTRFFGKRIASFDQVGKRLRTHRNEASQIVLTALDRLRTTLSR